MVTSNPCNLRVSSCGTRAKWVWAARLGCARGEGQPHGRGGEGLELAGDGGEEDFEESWWDGGVRKLNEVSGVMREVPNTSSLSETQAGTSEQRKREEDE